MPDFYDALTSEAPQAEKPKTAVLPTTPGKVDLNTKCKNHCPGDCCHDKATELLVEQLEDPLSAKGIRETLVKDASNARLISADKAEELLVKIGQARNMQHEAPKNSDAKASTLSNSSQSAATASQAQGTQTHSTQGPIGASVAVANGQPATSVVSATQQSSQTSKTESASNSSSTVSTGSGSISNGSMSTASSSTGSSSNIVTNVTPQLSSQQIQNSSSRTELSRAEQAAQPPINPKLEAKLNFNVASVNVTERTQSQGVKEALASRIANLVSPAASSSRSETTPTMIRRVELSPTSRPESRIENRVVLRPREIITMNMAALKNLSRPELNTVLRAIDPKMLKLVPQVVAKNELVTQVRDRMVRAYREVDVKALSRIDPRIITKLITTQKQQSTVLRTRNGASKLDGAERSTKATKVDIRREIKKLLRSELRKELKRAVPRSDLSSRRETPDRGRIRVRPIQSLKKEERLIQTKKDQLLKRMMQMSPQDRDMLLELFAMLSKQGTMKHTARKGSRSDFASIFEMLKRRSSSENSDDIFVDDLLENYLSEDSDVDEELETQNETEQEALENKPQEQSFYASSSEGPKDYLEVKQQLLDDSDDRISRFRFKQVKNG